MALVLTGSSATLFSWNAIQLFLKIQFSQSGFWGMQYKAPNSIMAWLKVPGCSLSISSCASCLNCLLPAPEFIGVEILKILESTLYTLPSTTAWASLKQILAIALAV